MTQVRKKPDKLSDERFIPMSNEPCGQDKGLGRFLMYLANAASKWRIQ